MLLFQNMSNPAPFSNVEVDLALKIAREELLCQVVSSAICAIPEELSSFNPGRRNDEPTEFLRVCFKQELIQYTEM